MTEKNKERWDILVSMITGDVRIKQFQNLVKYLEDYTSYFTAPASPKYHCSWEEGLLEHSMNVAENSVRFNRALKAGLDESELIMAGLFHDLGKAFIEENEPYYLIAQPTPAQAKSGYVPFPPFTYNNAGSIYLSVPQRAVRVVTQFIDISDAMYQAILVHDGQYVDDNKSYGTKENPMALILHYADSWSGFQIEGRVDKTESGKDYTIKTDDKVGKNGYKIRVSQTDVENRRERWQ